MLFTTTTIDEVIPTPGSMVQSDTIEQSDPPCSNLISHCVNLTLRLIGLRPKVASRLGSRKF